ncbi:MAG: [Fe-Fe] hydrogenase large subunit C-terminal domain-containing protein [Bacteroidota bacterium]
MNTTPQQTIYTEKNNCQDCYKCIRRCPVKAIKIEEHRASIMHELCIYCGKCVQVCPVNAKKVRNDVSTARYLVKDTQVVLSLAPSYTSEFTDYSQTQLLEALHQLGFMAVSETALAAEKVSDATSHWLAKQTPGVYLSSCCPTVVQLVCKYFPEQTNKLAPIDSPMQAHAKELHQHYGPHVKVVFAGPCIAKKQEAEDFPVGTDVALTFAELRQWLEEEGLTPEFLPETRCKKRRFSPAQAHMGAYYPIDGGMIATMKDDVSVTDTAFMSFSGLQNVRDVLEHLPGEANERIFIELLACDGGCVNGPAMSAKSSLAERRWKTLRNTQDRTPEPVEKQNKVDLTADYQKVSSIAQHHYTEQEIQSALKTVGKLSEKDELNCGGCGYESCRQFAMAMIEGKAERHMCVSYMRRVAQNKATVLLQKMPYGVVLVDESLHIVESNQHFAKLLGEDAERIYSVKPGMGGADLTKLAPFYKLFANALEQGLEEFTKDVRMEDQLFHISIFSIQQYKIVCGIVHQLTEEYFQKDQLVERLKDVVRDNLNTAQKAAFLLGENASRTETKLNTIIDSFTLSDNG